MLNRSSAFGKVERKTGIAKLSSGSYLKDKLISTEDFERQIKLIIEGMLEIDFLYINDICERLINNEAITLSDVGNDYGVIKVDDVVRCKLFSITDEKVEMDNNYLNTIELLAVCNIQHKERNLNKLDDKQKAFFKNKLDEMLSAANSNFVIEL